MVVYFRQDGVKLMAKDDKFIENQHEKQFFAKGVY